MSGQAQMSEKDKISAEEYEAQLYGFTVDEFISDNQAFIMTAIRKELQSVHDYTLRRLVDEKDLTEDLKSAVAKARKEDLQRIDDAITDKIASNYRKTIKEYMSIPDNCLLRTHMLHENEELKNMTADDVEKLKQEIDGIRSLIKRNATFIQGLVNENEAYQQVNEEFLVNDRTIQRAREVLEMNCDTSLLAENAKRIQEMRNEATEESEN